MVLICLSLVTNDGTATFSQWKKAKSVQETQRGAQGCRKKSRKKTWHPRSQQEKCFKKAVVKGSNDANVKTADALLDFSLWWLYQKVVQ